MTAGGALGAPVAGVAIDQLGWHGGFALPALLGLGTALAGGVLLRARDRRVEPRSPREPEPDRVLSELVHD
jgi:MFS family permease